MCPTPTYGSFSGTRPGEPRSTTPFGVGFLLAAFPEDGPPFGEPVTWAGYLHGVGLLVLVLTSFAGPLAVAVGLRGNPRWQGYSALSVIAAVASFGFLGVLVVALETATTLGVYGFFVTVLGWVGVLGHRLRQLEPAPVRRVRSPA